MNQLRDEQLADLQALVDACWFNGKEVGQPVACAPPLELISRAIEVLDELSAQRIEAGRGNENGNIDA